MNRIASLLLVCMLGGCSQASSPVAGDAARAPQENSVDTPTELAGSPEQLPGQELSDVLQKVQAESAEAQAMDFDCPKPRTDTAKMGEPECRIELTLDETVRKIRAEGGHPICIEIHQKKDDIE